MTVENRAYYLLGYEPAAGDGSKKPKARKIRVSTRSPGVELLHRSIYLPGAGGGNAVPELISSPLPVRDLPIRLAPAAVAIDKKRRGIVLPFEIGRDLRDDTEVEYSAMALDPEGKVVARANGRGRARDGRVAGDIALATESTTYQLRFAAHARQAELDGRPRGSALPKGGDVRGHRVRAAGPRAGLRRFCAISRSPSRRMRPETRAPFHFTLALPARPQQL